jgi:hypothetical protein
VRGDVSVSWDALIAALFFTLIGAMLIMYILSHTNSDLFFSRYHSVDVATSAQVVAAGNGDVVLRYGAIKPGSKLSYSLQNGRVGVGNGVPTATKFYGQAPRYDGPAQLETPTFLALRFIGGSFSIDDAQSLRTLCPAAAHAVAVDKAIVQLRATPATVAAFKDALKGTPIIVSDKAPTTIIVITRTAGDASLRFSPTNDEGRVYACHLARQFSALTAVPFSMEEPRSAGDKFVVDLTITTPADVTLTDEQVGKALAYALAVHYR